MDFVGLQVVLGAVIDVMVSLWGLRDVSEGLKNVSMCFNGFRDISECSS